MPRCLFNHVKSNLSPPANIPVSALLGSICVRMLLLLLGICWSIQTVATVFLWVHPFQNASWGKAAANKFEPRPVDGFRHGYPHFATLLSRDPSYYIFRRFS